MTGSAEASADYYPPPESQGGWRRADEPDAARTKAGVDLARLQAARSWNQQFGVPTSLVIIRRGYLVAEWHEHGADERTSYNIHSCSKSFTGTAYGILFEMARHGELPREIGLDTPAYAHIPEGYPLSDPRKAHITLRHLLSMSSNIPGEADGLFGVQTTADINPFDAALGHRPLNQSRRGPAGDLWAGELTGTPGTRWEYSDPAFAHLALAFRHITGQELAAFMQARVIDPTGIAGLTWDTMGIADGRTGIHTMPFSGVHVTARELARFGYLMLRGGRWAGRELVPAWWLELCTRTSQPMNPRYGLTWWVNTAGTLWPMAPRDAFSALGYNMNMCAVIPSLDLVVVRTGLGPTDSAENITPPLFEAITGSLAAAGGASR
jgi:CubicO group peptidase (beta-lactamase class C family)